jgi:transcription termination/antitermination protein NusG
MAVPEVSSTEMTTTSTPEPDEGDATVEVLDEVVEVVEILDADGTVVADIVDVVDVVEVTDANGNEVVEIIEVTELVAPDGEVLDEEVAVVEITDADDAEGSDEYDDEDEEVEAPESPYDRPGRWFVVHTYSGYENKVKGNLENIVKARELGDRIHEIVVPMEDVVEFKGGKKVTVSKKLYPGYILVRCTPSDDVWFAIRSSPGVTSFVGSASKPTPLSRREVESILHVKVEGVESQVKRARPTHEFELNETVRIKEGPFADFPGHIAEINEDQLKVKVLVDIFGRETPVELDFSQVAKL